VRVAAGSVVPVGTETALRSADWVVVVVVFVSAAAGSGQQIAVASGVVG